MEQITITQDMLDADPTLAQAGLGIGDMLPEPPAPQNEDKPTPPQAGKAVNLSLKLYKVIADNVEISGQKLPKDLSLGLTEEQAEPLLAKMLIEAVQTEPAKITEDDSHVSVYNPFGMYVRTYSLADHGEGYKALAEAYAGKIGGTTTPPKVPGKM